MELVIKGGFEPNLIWATSSVDPVCLYIRYRLRSTYNTVPQQGASICSGGKVPVILVHALKPSIRRRGRI